MEGGPKAGGGGFASAADLFAALSTPDAVARRGVLAWVAANPAQAIALGPHDGRDVLDLLLSLIDHDLDYLYWQDVAVTISAFDDPRATAFFADLLATAVRAEQAFDAAAALGKRAGAEGLADRVAEILLSDGPPERLVAAAGLMDELGPAELPPRALVRLAALDDDREAPPLDESMREVWLAELDGPLALETADRLAERPAEGAGLIAPLLEELDQALAEWLLAWIAADTSGRAAAIEALGPEAVERLRPFALEGAAEARGGAVRALLDLGDDEWLRERLLDEG